MLKTYRLSQIAYFLLFPLSVGAAVLMGGAAQADVTIINGRLSIDVGQPNSQLYSGSSHSRDSRQPEYYYYPDSRSSSSYSGSFDLDRSYGGSSNQVFVDRPGDATLVNPILVNPILVNPVIISPERTSIQDNPACSLFVSLRPACQ